MKKNCFIILFVTVCILIIGIIIYKNTTEKFTSASYLKRRNRLLLKNKQKSLVYSPYKFGYYKGKILPFNSKEKRVNNFFQDTVNDYIQSVQKTQGRFMPNIYFDTQVKKFIENSALFKKFIKSMPKGGSLHLHSGSQGDVNWIIKTGIYITKAKINGPDNQVQCVINYIESKNTPLGSLLFIKNNLEIPKGHFTISDLISTHFNNSKELFEDWLYKILTQPGHKGVNMGSYKVWDIFFNYFIITGNIMIYAPFVYEYILNSFQILVNDNCYLQEIRVLMGDTKSAAWPDGMGALKDLEGNTWTTSDIPQIYQKALNEFQNTYSNFKLKIISSTMRTENKSSVLNDLEVAYEAKHKYPNLIVGFDVVFEEDPTHTTLYYLSVWEKMKELSKKYNATLELFFHDGESDWISDTNVFDCVLLDCKRIGHGFNSIFFPEIIKALKRKDICLEVCPISNQILRYVTDLRIHPGNFYFHNAVPMIIGSDDPGAWGITGLSYDMWEVIMAWKLSLKDIKRLVFNSIMYSSLSKREREQQLQLLIKQWDEWINMLFASL